LCQKTDHISGRMQPFHSGCTESACVKLSTEGFRFAADIFLLTATHDFRLLTY